MSRTVVSRTRWRDEFHVTFDDGSVIRTARIPKRAPKSPRTILSRAADIIERRGLAKGRMRDESGCRCLYAALLEASGLGYDLEADLDAGHIDARQIETLDAYGRFENLREALALLGQPEAWGGRHSIGPLARWSDRSTTREVVRTLRLASYGHTPRWVMSPLREGELALR